MHSKLYGIGAGVCGAALSLTLVACGGGGSSTEAPKTEAATTQAVETPEAEAAAYGYASVEYEGWTLDFGTPTVRWDEDEEDDILIVPLRATNHKGKDSEFSNYDNFLVYPEDSDDYLDFAWDADEWDTDAEDEETPDGESIELCYAFELDGNYGTLRFAVRGYTVSDDETEVPLKDIKQTEECAAFEKAAAEELEAKMNATEAEMVGAKVKRAEGWYFDSIEDKSIELERESGESGEIEVSFSTVSDTPRDRAIMYAGNYGMGEGDVASATINGTEWWYFIPVDGQFQAYGQATDGIVNADGMFVSWEEAQPVMEGITLV